MLLYGCGTASRPQIPDRGDRLWPPMSKLAVNTVPADIIVAEGRDWPVFPGEQEAPVPLAESTSWVRWIGNLP